MLHKLGLACAYACFCTVVAAFAADDKPAKDKFDKAKIFEKMDADSDGKVTKGEFKKFREALVEKIKDKFPGAGDGVLDKVLDKMFEKIDADKDGTISKEEFEKHQVDPEQLKKLKEKIAEKKAEK